MHKLLDMRFGCGRPGCLSCGHYSELKATPGYPSVALFVWGC